VEPTTRTRYVGKIDKHIRPVLGREQVGKFDPEILES
jgi:integrase